MKLKIILFSFFLGLCMQGILLAQQEDEVIMYLNPFQKTQLIDDYLLLTDNLGLTMDRVPLLDSPGGTPLQIEPDQTSAYLKFNGALYSVGNEDKLQAMSSLIMDSKIDFRPINPGPLEYEGYYLRLPLEDTEHLGIKLLEYGYLEKLRINK